MAVEETIEKTILRHLTTRSFPDDGAWFFKAMLGADGQFPNRETYLWDFKGEWPFSYSDEYHFGLVKHIIAFANTAGGLLIFGVDDETRKIVPKKTRPNIDRLRRSITDLVSNPPELDLRTYGSEESGQVHVLIVYRRFPICLPASLKPEVAEKRQVQRFWVRVEHETVFAQAKHIALLFCGSAISSGAPQPVDAELPPSPATVRQFVGRLDTIERIFQWLHVSHEPRAFLYGRGGSGKTSIAFEVAKHLSASGSQVRFDNQDTLNKVIFVSAKEKLLSVAEGKSADFKGTDFVDEISLYRSIVALAKSESSKDPFEMDKPELIQELTLLFDTQSLLIIIDDIDTLTTKGIDPGFDVLFRLVSRAKRIVKILYTLRNAPSQSIDNSIEVLGLRLGREYSRFVEVCCRQFGVEEPTSSLRDGRLATITERRPLIVESIIALRKNSGSYERAIELFEENVGEDARGYIFQREWAALPPDNNARNLLCVLALYGQPVTFDDLSAMLRNEPTVIMEAISAVREMFIDVTDVDGNSTFALGSLTRAFVLNAARNLDKFPTIEARVNSFRKSFLPDYPELGRLLRQCEGLADKALRYNDQESAAHAWTALYRTDLAPKLTEDPRFRSLRGYVATVLLPPNLPSAEADFRYAFSMKYEPAVEYLKHWLVVVDDSGLGGSLCDDIVDFVGRGRNYREDDKLDFRSRRASRLYKLALEERAIDPNLAIEHMVQCSKIQATNFSRSVTKGLRGSLRYEGYYRNSTLLLFQLLIRNERSGELVDHLLACAEQDGALLDPTREAILEYLPLVVRVSGRQAMQRILGRLGHLKKVLSRASLWDDARAREDVIMLLEKLLTTTIPG